MDVDSMEEHCNYCPPYKHGEKFSEGSGLLSGLDQDFDSFLKYLITGQRSSTEVSTLKWRNESIFYQQFASAAFVAGCHMPAATGLHLKQCFLGW